MPHRSEAPRTVLALNHVTASKALDNGIELHSGSAVMEITALRDDVLRVRVGPEGKLPEDASWAVLPEARTAKVMVTATNSGGAVGFQDGEAYRQRGSRDHGSEGHGSRRPRH